MTRHQVHNRARLSPAERGANYRRSSRLLFALAVLGACGKVDDGAGSTGNDAGASGKAGDAAHAGAADRAGVGQGGELSEGGAGGYVNEAAAAGDVGAGGQTSGDDSARAGEGDESQSCPMGYFAHANGAPACRSWTDCEPGEFVLRAGTATSDRVCAPCEAGSFNSRANAATCTPCEAGTSDPQTGALACSSWTGLWQFGTIYDDDPRAVAADTSGDAYVVGSMDVALCEQDTAICRIDAFVRKYDAQGEVWMLQLGAENEYNFAYGAAVDAKDNLYVAGVTADSSANNAFLRKYDGDGNELWTRQLGPGDWVFGHLGVATDTVGNAYWVGSASQYEVSIRKYAADGAELWTRQFDSVPWTFMDSPSTDAAGNLYVVGGTQGDMAENFTWHWFLRKYNSSGEEQWTVETGVGNRISEGPDWGAARADAAGNVYIAGSLLTPPADPNSGTSKASGLLRKYDSSGAIQWSQELASPYADGFGSWSSVDVDGHGDVYVTGNTDGGLLQLPHPLNSDALIRKYDASGAELWTKELVASGNQSGNSISVAHDGRVFVAGSTSGVALPGQVDAGARDGFLVVYEPGP